MDNLNQIEFEEMSSSGEHEIEPISITRTAVANNNSAATVSGGMERFIDVGEAAQFVKLHRKTLLRFARKGSIPAHPLTGNKRRNWRFLLSELDAWARAKVNSTSDPCQNSRRK